MGKNEVTLKWKRNGKYFRKEVDRGELMTTFGNTLSFSQNYEVAKKLPEIIPVVSQIKINWDSTTEIKQLYYVLDGEEKGIPIIHEHSIEWLILKGYCIGEEEITEEDFKKIG